MVWFLIFMNLFMLAIITVTSIKKAYIPEDVIKASLSVIRQAGFEIADDIFPVKYYTRPTYKAQFYSASDLSELFFEKQIAFRTEGDSLVGTEGRAQLIVNDNFFSYDSGYSADESFSQKELKRALEKTGFDMTGAVYDEKTGYFYKMYNGSNLFNMSLEAKLDEDGENQHRNCRRAFFERLGGNDLANRLLECFKADEQDEEGDDHGGDVLHSRVSEGMLAVGGLGGDAEGDEGEDLRA